MSIQQFKDELLKKFPFCVGRTAIHLIGFGRVVVFIEDVEENSVIEIESYLSSILPLGVHVTVGDSMEVLKC